MKNAKLSNIPSMNIGHIVDALTNMYTAVIKQKLPMSTVPSVMLWASPSFGLSIFRI